MNAQQFANQQRRDTQLRAIHSLHHSLIHDASLHIHESLELLHNVRPMPKIHQAITELETAINRLKEIS